MVLFHFIFELIKISILGCIYATFILIIFKIVAVYKPKSWFNKTSQQKLKLWFNSGMLTSILLICFMFTFWGNHGLGDSARIPITYGVEIIQFDGNYTYLQLNGNQVLDEIKKFAITDEYILGKRGNAFIGDDEVFFIYKKEDNSINTFANEKSYINHLKEKKISIPVLYQDFFYYYDEYWNGWRFWLLP